MTVRQEGGRPVKTARWSIIFIVAALVAGCSQPPVPQDHFYRLEVAPPAGALASPRLPGCSRSRASRPTA